MEWADLIKLIADNGLGIASFVALIIFIFKYQAKANETLEEISKTLVQLVERVGKLEDKVGEKENK